MSSLTIKHANPTAAQTWNRLNINDITVVVPAPPAEPLAATVSDAFAGIEMGAGKALTAWIDASATTRETYTVPAGESADILIEVGANEIGAREVLVGAGANARIVVVAANMDDAEGTSALTLRIDAAEGAKVDYLAVTEMGRGMDWFYSLGSRLGDGASFEGHHYMLGGKLCVVGVVNDLVGENSLWENNVRYLAGRDERLDMNYTARHRGVGSKCVLDFNGVLSENAHKRLSDTIDLIHGCKGADGLENETVLVTGDEVINMALPSVLCREDDVAGDHGATIGSIAPERLAFMENRGLDLGDAQKLFTRSVFDAAATQVPEARAAVLKAALRVLGVDAVEEIEEELD
ncbi:MAG: SufD family Fe-S cluster assembly protein [Atopobiaceae bacterium]|nr:SufD family Fe-S cluster assembly protein [Atopobiaceae bacterium]